MSNAPRHLPPQGFPLGTDACELLIALEEAGTLTALAQARHRDISVISRQLQTLASRAPVLTKDAGRWRLTPLGKRFAQWGREAQAAQNRLLREKTRIRLVTTREFAARVMVPHLIELLGTDIANVIPEIQAENEGVERALLRGDADLGFDCGQPDSPSVRFRRARSEPLSLVASPEFLKKHRVRNAEALLPLPYLLYPRISAPRVLRLDSELPHIFGLFSDIASARAGCVAGLGWSVLPKYTVIEELAAGRLRELSWKTLEPEQFGVFWLPGNTVVEDWVPRAVDWLRAQDLG